MSRFCPLCGSELVNGVCPNQDIHFKPMCLNCKHCVADPLSDGATDETYRCTSEGNMTKAMNKLTAAMGDSMKDFGYEISLRPLPIKKPTLKCALWFPDKEIVLKSTLPFLYKEKENKAEAISK